MKKRNTRERLLDITFEEVYINGYASTSVDAILKRAAVPKGSMYHHFKSKKELVLAMVKERLYPKMDEFFKLNSTNSAYEALESLFTAMSKNKMLITYGCPMYRLMVELSPIDKDFDNLFIAKYNQLVGSFSLLLQKDIKSGLLKKELNTKEFASFVIHSTWGTLSLSPTLSSPKNFLKDSNYILRLLKNYYTD